MDFISKGWVEPNYLKKGWASLNIKERLEGLGLKGRFQTWAKL